MKASTRYFPRCTALAVLLLLGTATTYAQITITRSDILSAMNTGRTATGYTTPSESKVRVNVGVASASGQSWDFRSLTYTKQSDGEVIDPVTAPHRADFPAANLVYKLTLSGQATILFQYQEVTQEKYLLHGLGYSDATPLYRYSPPAVQMTFPCTRGTTWVFAADPISPVPGVTMQTTNTWTCDAFGTLRLPSGDYPALRLITETVTQSTTAFGSNLMRSYRYSFVTGGLTGATVSIDSSDIGKADVNGTVGYVVAGGATDAEALPEAESFTLGTPYPQPASDMLHIPVSTRLAGPMRVAIHDALGRECATILDTEIPAGITDAFWTEAGLAPGVYTCVATNGLEVKARLFVVAR